jgi:hypothetical protein
MTADSIDADRQRCAAAGMVYYVSKQLRFGSAARRALALAIFDSQRTKEARD